MRLELFLSSSRPRAPGLPRDNDALRRKTFPAESGSNFLRRRFRHKQKGNSRTSPQIKADSPANLRVSVFRDLPFPFVQLSGYSGIWLLLRRLTLDPEPMELRGHRLVFLLPQRVQTAVEPLLGRLGRLPFLRLPTIIHLV